MLLSLLIPLTLLECKQVAQPERGCALLWVGLSDRGTFPEVFKHGGSPGNDQSSGIVINQIL